MLEPQTNLTANTLSMLAYAQVFKSPLTRWQLNSFLHGINIFSVLTINKFLASHRHLWEQEVLLDQDWSTSFKETQLTIPSLALSRIAQVVSFFKYLPTIDSLWLTGSLAAGSKKPDQDIDFLVVCKPGTLWSTRALVSSWGLLHGKLRRRRGQHTSNRWCFNYWLETNGLKITESAHNLYQAREVSQALPLYQAQYGSALQFIVANTWVCSYSLTGWVHSWKQARQLVSNKKLIRYLPGIDFIFVFISRLLNPVLYHLQYWYMSDLPTDVEVNIKKAVFHSRWRQKQVLKKYETIMQLLGEESSQNL